VKGIDEESFAVSNAKDVSLASDSKLKRLEREHFEDVLWKQDTFHVPLKVSRTMHSRK